MTDSITVTDTVTDTDTDTDANTASVRYTATNTDILTTTAIDTTADNLHFQLNKFTYVCINVLTMQRTCANRIPCKSCRLNVIEIDVSHIYLDVNTHAI